MKPRKLVLILIFIFGFILRSIYIDKFPPSLNWDEVSHGYNAYSLLKTGRDEWGSFLPLIFRAYGDYKLPLYIYLTIPSVLIFGLTPFSVRLVSIVAGSLLPVLIYLIVAKSYPKIPKYPCLPPLFVCSLPALYFYLGLPWKPICLLFFFVSAFIF